MSDIPRPDPMPLEDHLEVALDAVDDDAAKYHVREACQKYIAQQEKSSQHN